MSPGTPAKSVVKHKEVIGQAIERLEKFWGEMKSNPVLILCQNRDEFKLYGSDLGTPAMIQMTPFGSYIVIQPEGINVDVISHELCHAELLKRVGWYHKITKVPAWFDEGLALMLDYRYPDAKGHSYEDYQTKWEKYTQKGKKTIPLEELTYIHDFFCGDNYRTYLAYLIAGREVKRWLQKVEKEGVLQFIQELRQGKSFQQAYQRQASGYF